MINDDALFLAATILQANRPGFTFAAALSEAMDNMDRFGAVRVIQQPVDPKDRAADDEDPAIERERADREAAE